MSIAKIASKLSQMAYQCSAEWVLGDRNHCTCYCAAKRKGGTGDLHTEISPLAMVSLETETFPSLTTSGPKDN